MAVEAYILVRLVGARAGEAHEAIRRIEGVKRASFVWGRYDLVACVEGPDAKAISDIATRVNAVAGVRSTETLVRLTT